ncbi:MAG: D-sedoheptulose 7-phosphate isomerase [Alphaproteobacteria bacterium]|nr:D-sedoheptulose 7-phosphate isomerase [Alphaproteobacteria bacterium]
MDLNLFFDSEYAEHTEVVARCREQLRLPFVHLVETCVASLRQGGKLMFFGNGGSAADAQHLATELTVRYIKNRAAVPAIALTTDTSALTAIGNDLGFERIFSRQVEALGKPGDVAIGITTSGKSPNVLKAFEQAQAMGITVAALTGKGGGDLTDPATSPFPGPILVVPSDTTARIQEMHIMLGQMLCGAIEIELGLLDDDQAEG